MEAGITCTCEAYVVERASHNATLTGHTFAAWARTVRPLLEVEAGLMPVQKAIVMSITVTGREVVSKMSSREAEQYVGYKNLD